MLFQEAFNLALSLASEEARERFESIGQRLFFDDDSVSPWGPGWEFSFGLHYDKVNETHTRYNFLNEIASLEKVITVIV